MKRIGQYILHWWRALAHAWAEEYRAVFSDVGVMIFFFALPTLYPIVYTLIYNPEVADNLPVAIVDNSRTVRSRELARMIDATQAMNTVGYAANLSEAREWMKEHRVVAIVEIPEEYDKCIGRGEQAVVPFYCDMSLLLRYRSILLAMSNIQLELGSELRTELIDHTGMIGEMAMGSSKQVSTESFFMGDTTQGFASFVMPGIFVLILQQSLMLGVCMLAGGRSFRRRMGRDPLAPIAYSKDFPGITGMPVLDPGLPATSTVIGRMLCYLTLYAPMVLYIFTIVPWMFSLPSVGHLGEYMIYVLPMLIASAFLGMLLGVFVTERESSMLVIVFTSVVFLFLSGLTWPRYAMPPFWRLCSDLIPASWGVDGFIRMASDGATLAEQSHPWHMMWLLAAVYFVLAAALYRYSHPRAPKQPK